MHDQEFTVCDFPMLQIMSSVCVIKANIARDKGIAQTLYANGCDCGKLICQECSFRGPLMCAAKHSWTCEPCKLLVLKGYDDCQKELVQSVGMLLLSLCRKDIVNE